MGGLNGSRRKGFVALEVMAVVGVIAMLLTLGFMLFRSIRATARVCEAQGRLRQVSTGLELYFRQYSSYPPQGSDLTQELAPFIPDPQAFANPLREEETPGQTLNALYRQPSMADIDAPDHYLTAMVSDDGTTAVVLSTGNRVEPRHDLNFDPNAPASDLLAMLNPTDPPDPPVDDHQLGGSINLNPNNSDDFEFRLDGPNGLLITRDDLKANGNTYAYTGPAMLIRVKPKGNGNQNSLTLDGQPCSVRNGTVYTITSDNMTVHLYNSKAGQGQAMGKWWIDITAANATITPPLQ